MNLCEHKLAQIYLRSYNFFLILTLNLQVIITSLKNEIFNFSCKIYLLINLNKYLYFVARTIAYEDLALCYQPLKLLTWVLVFDDVDMYAK